MDSRTKPPGEALPDGLWTPLHEAAAQGFVDVTRALLITGANPNARDEDGQTPLHWAEDTDCARLLLAAGASPNAADADGLTPLDYAEDDAVRETLRAEGGKTGAQLRARRGEKPE